METQMLHKTLLAVATIATLAAASDTRATAQETSSLKSVGKQEPQQLPGTTKYKNITLKRGSAAPSHQPALTGKQTKQRMWVPAVQKVRERAAR
jgi:hypothetical protein